MISSKFSFRYYLGCIFSAAMLAMGIYGVAHAADLAVVKHGVKETPMIICCFQTGLGLLGLFAVLIYSVRVKVWTDRIVVQRLFFRTTILKEDITSMDLTARKPLNLSRMGWQNRPIDVIVINRKQGRPIQLEVRNYRNSAVIRRTLQQDYQLVATPQPRPPRQPHFSDPVTSVGPPRKYARNWLFSGFGFMFWGIALMLGWLFFGTQWSLNIMSRLCWYTGIMLAFYGGFSTQLFYFALSDRQLIIRNHFFPWYSRSFDLADIRSAVIENPAGPYISLRITLQDFEWYNYRADSLRKPEWNALAERLREKDIPVVNEAY